MLRHFSLLCLLLAPLCAQAQSIVLWALANQGGANGLRYPAEDGRYEKEHLDALKVRAAQRH